MAAQETVQDVYDSFSPVQKLALELEIERVLHDLRNRSIMRRLTTKQRKTFVFILAEALKENA